MAEHLDKCTECLAEADAVERLLRETEAVRSEIRAAAASVDWETLPGLIADRAMAGSRKPERALSPARPQAWLFPLRVSPALAGLLAGLVVGAAAMYFVLRVPGSTPGQDLGFYASGEFLDRAELEMARRTTLDYLEKSQYVLLDVFETVGEGGTAPAALSSARARDLLWQSKIEFLAEDETVLFRYLTEGFLRQESQLEVTPSLERVPEMPWLILFGWYLVVMMHEDSAATAAVVS